jgi:RNA polymerase sigma factor (sigma-70 family)
MNDERLIRDYCLQGDQQAFAELVRRYASLVYGTARRHVGDPFVAEEICQKTFCALATQMVSIKKPSHLPAWLYQTTRRLAAMQVRSDQRRVARERIAATMIVNDPEANKSWERIEPLLNEGLDTLGEKDRAAILLRFFRGMTMAEVAQGLGTTEAAAKMRVGRAVEKLRTFFSQHGATCSIAGLLILLEENACAEPPASVIGSILQYVARNRPISMQLPRAGPPSRALLPIAGGVALLGLLWFSAGRSPVSPRPTETSSSPLAVSALETAPASTAPEPKQTPVSDGQVRLTILDEKSSTPLSGARVSASNLGRPLGEAVTDFEGHCDLPKPTLADGDFYYNIRAECNGYASMNVSWSRFQRDESSDVPGTYELKMAQGARIGGLVTDEEGHPLMGIQLKLQGRRFGGGPPPRQRARLNDGASETVITDPAGKWSFDRLPPEWEDILFKLNSQEFLTAEYVCDANRHPTIGQLAIAKAELLNGLARMQLHRGPLIVGQVLDQSQQPIAGVRLVQNFHWFEDYATTTTGNDGVYRLLNAPKGMLSLSFQADHYSPQTVSVAIDGPTTNPPVVLAPGHQLRARVLDDAGHPLDGVAVDVRQGANMRQEFQWRTNTDAAGAFAWDGAPDKPLTVTLSRPGFQTTRASLNAAGSEQTITLQRVTLQRSEDPGIRVKGEVVDEATGQPIPKFKFFISEGRDDAVVPKEGAEGRFSIRLEGQSRPVKIEVQAEGHEPAASEPIPTTNGDQTVAFRLRRSDGWNGLVLLPNGEPAAGAEVALSRHLKWPILGRRKLLFREQYVYRLADTDGRFHFDAAKDARLIIAVHQQGYAERDLDTLAANPNVQLQPWGRVQGTLRSSGHALPNEKVVISKRFWNPWVAIVLHPEAPFVATTDEDGRFLFDDVPPGDHSIGRLFLGGMLETRTTVQVNPGETTAVELGGNGRPVAGKIHVPKFEPGFDFSHSRGELRAVAAKPVDLPNMARRSDFPTDEAYVEAEKLDGARRAAYWQSAEGLAAWRQARSYAVRFDADGTLHADDVPAGEYDLNVSLEAQAQPGDFPPLPRSVGYFKGNVVISGPGALK